MMSHNRSEALRVRIDTIREAAVHGIAGVVYNGVQSLRNRQNRARVGLAGAGLLLALGGTALTGNEASAYSPPTGPDGTPTPTTIRPTATPRPTYRLVDTRTTTPRPPRATPTRHPYRTATRRSDAGRTATPTPTSSPEAPSPYSALLQLLGDEEYTCEFDSAENPVIKGNTLGVVPNLGTLNVDLPDSQYSADGENHCSSEAFSVLDYKGRVIGSHFLRGTPTQWTQIDFSNENLARFTRFRFISPKGANFTLIANSGEGDPVFDVNGDRLVGGRSGGQVVLRNNLTGRYGVGIECPNLCQQSRGSIYVIPENDVPSGLTTNSNNGTK